MYVLLPYIHFEKNALLGEKLHYGLALQKWTNRVELGKQSMGGLDAIWCGENKYANTYLLYSIVVK